MSTEEKSEFGKGLVICLVKFAEHFMLFGRQMEEYKKAGISNESSCIEVWANGASDHLYEIEIPPEWKNTEIGTKVSELKNLGLEMGHGFKCKHTKKDVDKLFNLTQKIAILIDKKLGLEPDIGSW